LDNENINNNNNEESWTILLTESKPAENDNNKQYE
jgi:hypothetical protein